MTAPGIIRDLPFPDYLAIEALSPSGAGKLLRSPAHYRAYRDAPETDTPAFRLGRAVHALGLEGRDAYRERFAVAPEGIDRRTKIGKEAWAAFEVEAAGKTILTANEAQMVEAMGASLAAHALIPSLLQGGEAETSMFWDDPDTGAQCKGRPDFARLADGTILDMKTTLDASPGAFARACVNYGYGVQAAAYRAGARAWGFDVMDYLLLAVEKSPPFACAVYRLPDAALELGRRRWAEACALYAQCDNRHEWPGYSYSITELTWPNWAMNELYSEGEE